MKILSIDIETRPSLAYVWKLWDENVGLNQLVQSGEMISFAAKWYKQPGPVFYSVFHNTKEEMINAAWELLDTADVAIHYNGKKFDIPHIQREFLESGLGPTSPFKQIDLLQTCRSQFRFPSNKLEYVSKQLGIGTKIKHEGFELWKSCIAGDAKAWERMKKYNVQDVILLEKLYDKLQPWVKTHPSFAAFNSTHVCPRCNSDDLGPRGYAVLTTGRYQRYLCNHCGSWSRDTTRYDGTDIVAI